MKKVRKIYMSLIGIIGLKQYLWTDYDESGICWLHYKQFGQYPDYEAIQINMKISKNHIEHLYNFINKIDISKWKKRYFNPDIADGCLWGMIIYYEDGSVFKSTGQNDFPCDWKRVVAMFKSISQNIVTFFEENNNLFEESIQNGLQVFSSKDEIRLIRDAGDVEYYEIPGLDTSNNYFVNCYYEKRLEIAIVTKSTIEHIISTIKDELADSKHADDKKFQELWEYVLEYIYGLPEIEYNEKYDAWRVPVGSHSRWEGEKGKLLINKTVTEDELEQYSNPLVKHGCGLIVEVANNDNITENNIVKRRTIFAK